MRGAKPKKQDQIRDMQAQESTDGEPIIEGLSRKVRQDSGRGCSQTINIPKEAERIVGFIAGDDASIDVYEDHIEIRP